MLPDGYRILDRNDRLILAQPATRNARASVLCFIRTRFLEHFGARVDDDSPLLVGAFAGDGRLVAAFGLRDPSSEFFCEHYLDAPLELALARCLGRPVGRGEVIELTHLCAIRPGTLRELLSLLPGVLLGRGHRYLACTATACLAAFLQRRGVAAVTLADARADALPADQRAAWGAYYNAGPRVLAGDLLQAAVGPTLPADTARAAQA